VRDSRLLAPGVMADVCARQRRILGGDEAAAAEEGAGGGAGAVEISLSPKAAAPATRPWVVYAGIGAVVLGAMALLLPYLLGDGSSPSPLDALTNFSLGTLVYLGVAAFGATTAITAARHLEIISPPILLGIGLGFAAIFFEIGRAMFPSLSESAKPAPAVSVAEVPESLRRAMVEAPVLERQGLAAREQGKLEEARQAFAQALADFETARDIDGQVRVLLAQAEMEHDSGEAASELESYRRAALLMQSGPAEETDAVLGVLHKIVGLAESLGDDERLLDAHTALLRFKERTNDRKGQSREYVTLAEIYRRRGDYERAHEWYNRAHGVYQDLRDKKGQVQSLQAIAEIEQFLGRRRQAYGSYYHAFVLYREMDDAEGQASMLLYLGALDELSQRWAEASAAFRQAQRIYAARGDRAGEAKAAFRFGTVQAAHGNARQAREAFNESLGFFESIGDTSSQAGVLRGLAQLEQRDDHVEAARIRYERSLQLYRAGSGEVSDMGELAVLLDLALLEHRTGRPDAALRAYGAARDLVTELSDRSQRARLLLGVADMGVKLGRSEEALAMYNDAVSIFVEIGDTSGESTARDRLAAIARGDSNAGI
jgi:tetratricopeptide (TPR) repeat protein